MGKNQHVVPRNDKWAVKGEGNSKATKVTLTQKEAIIVAKGIAKNNNSELVIHRPDGRIREKNSYGSDPFPPEG
ncbi:MAG: DUF2188 domain-containing protein [Prolixibacteraceae bacterium]|jgi:hypothetical protein|nr:DUF2188 domain-containing protein [Prolixibacteraceae bacterium]